MGLAAGAGELDAAEAVWHSPAALDSAQAETSAAVPIGQETERVGPGAWTGSAKPTGRKKDVGSGHP